MVGNCIDGIGGGLFIHCVISLLKAQPHTKILFQICTQRLGIGYVRYIS